MICGGWKYRCCRCRWDGKDEREREKKKRKRGKGRKADGPIVMPGKCDVMLVNCDA